ncbi:MAG: gamma-glutamyl-gamma-aminobutyrate hydrolase family protein [Anaerolineales bacterium]|nr:gamma-glutamyl-gamma-aminobutyrate hydrolase family protein [Anaerolineales bacterium]
MPALIGITTYRGQNAQGYPILALAEAYVNAIAAAGGLPVLIPLGLDAPKLESLVDRLDGVLFSGGGDVAPERYGAPPVPAVGNIDPDRDRVELALLERARRAELPFLGICRGFQVINVAYGGTLYTHIADQHPQALKHDYYPDWERHYLAHAVEVQPGTRLAEIVGQTRLQVNSLHHQGVQHLGAGLQPLAWSPDGLLEAFQAEEHPFGLAVQWHPENLTAQAEMRALFRAFVEAAG